MCNMYDREIISYKWLNIEVRIDQYLTDDHAINLPLHGYSTDPRLILINIYCVVFVHTQF